MVTNPDFFPKFPPLKGCRPLRKWCRKSVQPARALPDAVVGKCGAPVARSHYARGHIHQLSRAARIAVGRYQCAVAGKRSFPLGQPNPVFLMESSGLYNQNQLVTNLNSRVNDGLSIFGFYVLEQSHEQYGRSGTFPANPYNFTGEYGPASTDVRNRFTAGGSINTRWNIRISPFVTLQSGPPFNITTGTDVFGTTLLMPGLGIATDPKKTGVIETPYGLLDPNPTPDEKVLPRNDGRGPALISVNLRIGKTFGFGGEKPGASTSHGGGGGGNPTMMASGRGLGSFIGPPTTTQRYNLSISMSARNS